MKKRLSRREVCSLLRGIYGPGLPVILGSPYEGDSVLNDSELVLHELAHLTQFDLSIAVPGAMEPTWQVMTDALKAMSKAESDQHEVIAVAVTFLASEALRLRLCKDRLIATGARNSFLLFGQHDKFAALVAKAEEEPRVRLAVNQVLDLIERARDGSL